MRPIKQLIGRGVSRFASGKVFRWAACLLSALAVLYVVDAIRFPDIGCSSSLPHRLQVDAFLRGCLSLSTNVSTIDSDLTYSRGGVHQVWGLGIPFWRLLFEGPARFFLNTSVPDRLPLVLALAALFYLGVGAVYRRGEAVPPVGNTGFPGRALSQLTKLAAVWMITCGPFLLNLLRTRMLVYEETLVYTYIFAVAQAILILKWVREDDPVGAGRRFMILCAVAGAGGLIRPTLILYGAATVLVALIFQRRLLRPRDVGLAAVFLLAPIALLAWTNWLRFGAPWEFGHTMNVQDLQESLYVTHMESPYSREGIWAKLKELVGALFLVHQFNGCSTMAPHIFPGQSEFPRWREFNYTTLDPLSGAAAGLFLIVVVVVIVLGRQSSRPGLLPQFSREVIAGAAWSLLSILLLTGFYCGTPVLTARYMYDFAPAITLALALAVRTCLGQTLAVLATFLLCGFSLTRFDSIMDIPGIASVKQAVEFAEEWRLRENKPAVLPREYHVGMARLPDVPLACTGWDPGTGDCKLVSIFYVESTPRVTVRLAAPASSMERFPASSIRLTTGCGLLWPQERATMGKNELEIVFAAPKWFGKPRGPIVLFVSIGSLEQWLGREERPRLMAVITQPEGP